MINRSRSVLRKFLSQETSGGIVLMVSAMIAFIIANSTLAPLYFGSLHTYVIGMSALHWINDGLMAAFFLLVGLEIKRELIEGALSTWPRRALPGFAAIGGMIVPALIYVLVNANSPDTLSGWAIPAGTDIAFALGVLSLAGKRTPISLKIFLTALAILDDLGAILIIAVFYSAQVSVPFLALAAATFGILIAMNKAGILRLTAYLLLGALLWFFVLKSGIHATLAGVALAATIPLRSPSQPDAGKAPLRRLEHALIPWVAFIVVPVFGFANAGVSLDGLTPSILLAPVPFGIAAGLLIGKQVGVFGFSWVAIRLRLADLPAHATWSQLYGVAILCGIGFTMSLFIGLLAFSDVTFQDEAKVGVLVGSLLSAFFGALVIWLNPSTLPKSKVETGKLH